MRFVAGVLVGLVRQRVCVMCVGGTCMPRVHAHPVLFVKEVGRMKNAASLCPACVHVALRAQHLHFFMSTSQVYTYYTASQVYISRVALAACLPC